MDVEFLSNIIDSRPESELTFDSVFLATPISMRGAMKSADKAGQDATIGSEKNNIDDPDVYYRVTTSGCLERLFNC